jgi:dUTP pyrophosphatase
VFVANAPGIVDPDYTGEIRIILFNGGIEPFFIKHGDRIAQLLVVPFAAPSVVEIEGLPETPRGERGFGSTGA